MAISSGTIDFDHVGIGKAIANNRLKVPVNQREYSWEDEQVREILDDLYRAIAQGAYFLGTIVLTKGSGGLLEVADGQQRLATVTILLASIRDHFFERNDTLNVESIETEFLNTIDRAARKRVPRLTLNVDDNEFFRKAILSRPNESDRKAAPLRDSHKRIERARKLAAKHVLTITRNRSDQSKTETLLHWVEFIANGAQVIMLTVPDHLNAFRMFETLNDRGLKTSQADLLKNYLFGESGERISEAQHRWSAMSGTLESAGIDDIVLTYLRHLLVAKHGATREREVYDKIRSTVSGSFPAIEFLDDLSDNANTYVALLNHRHPHWNEYGNFSTKIRRHIETLNELRVEQIRPLMLACMKSLPPKEVEKSFRVFIAWAVRFMIAGGPTGTIEKYYAARAVEVWKGDITSYVELAKAMNRYLPDDDVFKSAFATSRVSKSHLARYFLRSLEQKIKNDPEPENVVNDDQLVLTLEHVLPENLSAGWSDIDADEAAVLVRRLGNMVLLRASANSRIGNESFAEKKKIYKSSSSLELTKQILNYARWGKDEIDKRQAEMAKLAVKIWSL
jgi:hypothetical protein